MSPFVTPRRWFIIGSLCALTGIASGRDLSGVNVTVVGGNASTEFLRAASDLGAHAKTAHTITPQAGIVVYDTRGRSPGSDDAPKTLSSIKALLNTGGSVIFTMPERVAGLKSFEPVMPVNLWSADSDSLQRLSTGAVAPADSPLSAVPDIKGIVLPSRFDLHLPYSTMETGQQRYDWQSLGKTLINTDWRVLLNSDQDGRLPLLVEGRYGPGRVFVFAGDLFAPSLTTWPGYDAFVKVLLKAAKPAPVPSAVSTTGVTITTARQQAVDNLAITVTNGSATDFRGVLLVKVRNFPKGIMNSFSKDIAVPAGKTIRVPVSENSAERGTDRIAADAISFRYIEAGLAGPDRREIGATLSTLVDCTPPVTVSVSTEDVRTFQPKDNWGAGGNDFIDGNGMHLGRSLYFCGEKPVLTVRVGNAFHNIAPLAKPEDLNWPDNPTAQGLNDGGYSYGSVRGRYPIYGYWVGRSASEQRVMITWPEPVTIARSRLVAQTDHRNWDQSNPINYTLSATNGTQTRILVEKTDAAYVVGQREDAFLPTVANACTLTVSGLDAKANRPPSPDKNNSYNCALGEWEIHGWPSTTLPPPVKGRLVVTYHDLSDDATATLLDKTVMLQPGTEMVEQIEVPTSLRFGQVSVHAQFIPEEGTATSSNCPLTFVPPDADHLVSRSELGDTTIGMLCSPGFLVGDNFGLGTWNDTQGWGGPDDQTWAWANGLMEMNSRVRESAQRLFLSPVDLSHYTNPWQDFPSGYNVWDWITDKVLGQVTAEKSKRPKTLHFMLSDRWNGVHVRSAFTWSNFVAFDRSLRADGKPGLEGKTRAELCQEITTRYADQFQRFALTRYADTLARSQRRFAEAGIDMTTETHGSFPLAGGELGQALAATDVGVGTDLFWELKDEDLFKSLGYRYGLVAANPDLKSGAYNQWGWISGKLANYTWFAPSGDVEPSRRQWYSTYWMGRVTSDGVYQPYTVYGFSAQGGYGAKNTPTDWDAFNRVQSAMIRIRPEKAAGFGLVTSWRLHESRMGPEADKLGFGLFAAKGHEQVDITAGELYQRLVKNGVPIGFVASTHTLRKWEGIQPLVVVDGFDIQPIEIAEFRRLNATGTPIIAVGSDGQTGRTEAEAFFGVKRNNDEWIAQPGTSVIAGPDGQAFAYVTRRPGAGAILFCPTPVTSLNGQQSALLASLCLRAAETPLKISQGYAVTPVLSQGSLFLLIASQRDSSETVEMFVRPANFDPAIKTTRFRIIDHEQGVVIPARWDAQQDALRFAIPCAPNDGRMIQILPLPSSP